MAKKKLSDRNTKAEILTAYNALLTEKKELLSQLKQAAQTAAQPVSSGNGVVQDSQQLSLGAAPTETVMTSTVLTAASQPSAQASIAESLLTMEAMLGGLDQLQLGFGNAISGLSKNLTERATQLSEIRALVTTEIEQLEALHDLEADDVSLDGLIQQYEENFETFSEELESRREALERAYEQAGQAWAKERETHDHETEVEREAAQKAQKREDLEYRYGLSRDRKLSNEAFEQGQARSYEALADAKQAQEKAWTLKETEIREQEEEFETLEAKVTAFPEALEAAIKKATEEGKGIAHHQAKVKADLAAQEREGQREAYELRIESLSDTFDNQEQRIQDLSDQLSEMLGQVQDLAVKAIEGASNVKSLQAMKEIALEQAKTPSKGK